MNIQKVILAVAAPGREGLELAATRLDEMGERLRLTAPGGGAVLLDLENAFLFAYGYARLEPAEGGNGRIFVDAVARWLGMELNEVESSMENEPTNLDCRWVRLGNGEDVGGSPWMGFKLFLCLGDRYAEVFFRVSSDGRRAQLIEKWSEYRRALVEILERVLNPSRPRSIVSRQESSVSGGDVMSFEIYGALELDLPFGWRISEQPEGHHRMTDPDDEMMIDFSYMRLPPLPSDALDVAARLRAILDASPYRDEISPITTFERDGVVHAWSEYRWNARDSKQPTADPLHACSRWLLAANDWIQVIVNGNWWEKDSTVAERAWDDVVASLRLRGRIVSRMQTRGKA